MGGGVIADSDINDDIIRRASKAANDFIQQLYCRALGQETLFGSHTPVEYEGHTLDEFRQWIEKPEKRMTVFPVTGVYLGANRIFGLLSMLKTEVEDFAQKEGLELEVTSSSLECRDLSATLDHPPSLSEPKLYFANVHNPPARGIEAADIVQPDRLFFSDDVYRKLTEPDLLHLGDDIRWLHRVIEAGQVSYHFAHRIK